MKYTLILDLPKSHAKALTKRDNPSESEIAEAITKLVNSRIGTEQTKELMREQTKLSGALFI